jgi:REP element-mobilizing transposase RayT
MHLRFFNPYAEVRHTGTNLPHWQQQGAVYFPTFRTADSVPAHLLTQWENERETWLKWNPLPHTPEQEVEYHRRFSGAIEGWLDAGHGECVLRDPALACLMGDTLAHFDGERYAQIAWVVMPNHIHAVVVQHPSWPLEKVLHSWKSFSSKALNERLGRDGVFWQRDYFDRLVRDEEHFANCVRYIRRNPSKARLREGEYLHFESEIARTVADHAR